MFSQKKYLFYFTSQNNKLFITFFLMILIGRLITSVSIVIKVIY